MNQKIEIKFKIVVYTILFLLGLLLAYEIRNVLIMLFFAFIINSGLRPWVDKLQDKGVPRLLSIGIIYTTSIGFLTLVFFLTINQLLKQLVSLLENLPDIVKTFIDNINDFLPENLRIIDENEAFLEIEKYISSNTNLENLNSGNILRDLVSGINVIGIGGISIVTKIIGGLVSIFTVIVVSIYMLEKRENLYDSFLNLAPKKFHQKAEKLIKKIEKGLGEWLIGQIILMFIIGIASYILIMIPKVLGVDDYSLYKFALVIALMAGVLEAIPQLGPFLTVIATFILAIGTGASLGILIYIGLSFWLLQVLESVFIVPTVMRKAAGVDPVLTILGILAGLTLDGPLLALLSVPILVALKYIVLEVSADWKKNEKN